MIFEGSIGKYSIAKERLPSTEARFWTPGEMFLRSL